MPSIEKVILSAQVPAETAEELKRLAAHADRSVSAEVRRALNLHLLIRSQADGLDPEGAA
jgi:hypothetical protein